MRSKPSPPNPIGEEIGKELRAIYDVVLNEPIPDRFRALIDRLGDEIMTTASDPLPAQRRAPVQSSLAPRAPPQGVKRFEVA